MKDFCVFPYGVSVDCLSLSIDIGFRVLADMVSLFCLIFGASPGDVDLR